MKSVFKFWVIGGIFLHMFADALLFDMVLNTAFEDGVDTHQDLIERDMFLGTKKEMKKLKSVMKLIDLVIWPGMQSLVDDMKTSDYESYRILGIINKC